MARLFSKKNKSLTFSDPERLLSSINADFPLVLNIEPTNRCNLKCAFCVHDVVDVNRGDISRDLIDNIVNEIKQDNRRLELVAFHKDGEPLLFKDLPAEIYKFKCTNRVGILHLNTNGVLLSKAKGEYLALAGLDSITVSLDAFHHSTYEELKGYDFRDLVYTNTIEMCDTRDKYGNPTVRVKIMDVEELKEGEKEAFFVFWNQYADFVQDHYVHNWSGKVDIAAPQITKNRYACPLPWYIAVVSWDGEVSLCSFDWNRTTSIGKLDYDSGVTLHKLWVGEKVKKIRRELLLHNWACAQVCDDCASWSFAPDIEEELAKRGEFL